MADAATSTPDRGGQRCAAAAREAVEHEERQGPQQVDLLLDRERPEVREGARRRGGVEVGDVPPGVVPVRDVGERCEPVGPDVVELPARHPAPRREGDPDERDEERREETAGPSQPEPSEVDAAAASRVAPRVELEDEQRRDEEAGQDEEQVDAEEPARQRVGAQVEDDDGRHRQPAQPVQAGHRPEVRPRRSVERSLADRVQDRDRTQVTSVPPWDRAGWQGGIAGFDRRARARSGHHLRAEHRGAVPGGARSDGPAAHAHGEPRRPGRADRTPCLSAGGPGLGGSR